MLAWSQTEESPTHCSENSSKLMARRKLHRVLNWGESGLCANPSFLATTENCSSLSFSVAMEQNLVAQVQTQDVRNTWQP